MVCVLFGYMVELLISPLVLVGLMAAVYGWGRLVFPGGDWSGRYGAGALAVYALVAILGWIGLLRPAFLWVVAAVGLASVIARPGSLLPKGWKAVLAAALILLPLAALPPFSRDAMNHHLFLPRLWLENGALFRPAWAKFFSFPYLVESLQALVGGTAGLRFGRLVSLSGLLASVACVSRIAGGGRRGAAAAVVLLSIPELLRNGTWAFADTYLVLFSLLALKDLSKGEAPPWRPLLWASAAACCKYNGAILIPLVALALLMKRRSWSRRDVGLSLAAVALPALTWALPNLIQWGNPVYPRLAGIFGGIERSARAEALLADFRAYTASLRGVEDLLLLPVRMSMSGQWDNPRLFDGSSGPLLLAGLVLSLIISRRRRVELWLPLAYIVLAQAVLGPVVRVRYLLPGLAMLSVRAAGGLLDAARRGRAATLLIGGLAAVCLIWSGSWLVRLYGISRPWSYRNDSQYLEEMVPYMEFYRECGEVLESGSVTLLVNLGNRAYYFPGDVRFDAERFPMTLLEKFWRDMSAEDVAEELREAGITHIALNINYTVDNLFVELDAAQRSQCSILIRRYARPLVIRPPYGLLRLEEVSEP